MCWLFILVKLIIYWEICRVTMQKCVCVCVWVGTVSLWESSCAITLCQCGGPLCNRVTSAWKCVPDLTGTTGPSQCRQVLGLPARCGAGYTWMVLGMQVLYANVTSSDCNRANLDSLTLIFPQSFFPYGANIRWPFNGRLPFQTFFTTWGSRLLWKKTVCVCVCYSTLEWANWIIVLIY